VVVHDRGSRRRRGKRHLPCLLSGKQWSNVRLAPLLWLLPRKNARDERDHERDRQ